MGITPSPKSNKGVGAGKAIQNYYIVHIRGAEINLGCAKAILCSLACGVLVN